MSLSILLCIARRRGGGSLADGAGSIAPLLNTGSVGTLTGGTYVVGSNAVFKFTGADIDVNAATIVSDGLGSAILNESNALGGFRDNDGGFTIKADRDLTTSGALTNDGTIDLGANSVLTTTGDYVQAAGSTNLGETTSKLVASGASVKVQGGTLKGVGTVGPALTVSGGRVVPGLSPGVMKVTGSYAQSAGSTLEVEIGGTIYGADYDQLDVDTTASLGGTLDIKTLSGFTPSANDSFTIIKCGAANCPSGQFDTVQGANLGPDLDYQVHYNATDVTLVFVDNRMVDTSISLAANPEAIILGETTTLSGTLTRSSGGGIPDKQVILEHKPAGETDFTQVGDPATTDANGDFSFAALQPAEDTEYRVRFAGDQAARLNASVSGVETVTVSIATSLTLVANPETVPAGQTTDLSGRLTKTAGGDGVSGVTVILEHKPDGESAFSQVATQNTDGSGYFSFDNVLPTEDTEYRARFGGDQASRLNASTSNVELVAVLALTNLTLVANPPTVTFPNSTTLSGTLTRADNGVGISGKQVILEHKPAGAIAFTRMDNPEVVNPVTTSADGSFSFVGVQPTKKTDYRVTFAGDHASRLDASTSDAKAVEVKVGLTLKVSRTTVKLGRKVTISGVVSPEHTGTVQLTIKRGKKVLVNQKSVPLNGSLYRTPFKPTGAGSYTVIVSFAGDEDHLGNTATKKFKVTR